MSSERRKPYPFDQIEPKWQAIWDERQIFHVPNPGEKSFDAVFALNVKAAFFVAQACVKKFRQLGRGGAIVNVSSVFSDRGLSQHAAYTASKHGVHGLTRTAAHDYAGDKVRINELLPGVIDTPMLDSNRGMVDQMTAFIPQRRLGEPLEVARAICFLLGDGASYMTGARVAVDGGFLV